MKGCLITFEGIEGSGKTVQARMLEEWLRKRGYGVVYTREPTRYANFHIGQLIHQILEKHIQVAEEAIPLLFAADRVDHTKRYIIPELKKGSIVLCDRYVFSSLAYQSRGMSVQFSKKWLKEINKYAKRPDIVFFLDIDPEEGLKRIKKDPRIHDDKFFERPDTQKLIREAYYDILNLNEPMANFFESKSVPHSLLSKLQTLAAVDQIPVISIDGALPKEEINKIIREIVQKLLKYKETIKRRPVRPEELFKLIRFTDQ